MFLFSTRQRLEDLLCEDFSISLVVEEIYANTLDHILRDMVAEGSVGHTLSLESTHGDHRVDRHTASRMEGAIFFSSHIGGHIRAQSAAGYIHDANHMEEDCKYLENHVQQLTRVVVCTYHFHPSHIGSKEAALYGTGHIPRYLGDHYILDRRTLFGLVCNNLHLDHSATVEGRHIVGEAGFDFGVLGAAALLEAARLDLGLFPASCDSKYQSARKPLLLPFFQAFDFLRRHILLHLLV